MCQLYQKSMKDPDDPREQDPDDDPDDMGDMEDAPYDMRSQYETVHCSRFIRKCELAQDLVSLT